VKQSGWFRADKLLKFNKYFIIVLPRQMLNLFLIFLRQPGNGEKKKERIVVVGLLLLKKHKGERAPKRP
jgi:hypothetical protein